MTTDTERTRLIAELKKAADDGWPHYKLLLKAAAYIEQHPPVDAAVERDAVRYQVLAEKLESLSEQWKEEAKAGGLRGAYANGRYQSFGQAARELRKALTAQQQENGS